MNKSRLFALVAASLVSTSAIAAAQAPAAGNRSGQHREIRGGLVHGLKLSAEEKSRVKEIHAKYKAENQSIRESLKPAMLEARTARQKGDTAAVRAIMERTKANREKGRDLMVREKNEFRAALTPEHQKQFDANVKQAVQKREHGKKGKGTRALRHTNG